MDLQRLLTSTKTSNLTRSASLFTKIVSAIKLRNKLKVSHRYGEQLRITVKITVYPLDIALNNTSR